MQSQIQNPDISQVAVSSWTYDQLYMSDWQNDMSSFTQDPQQEFLDLEEWEREAVSLMLECGQQGEVEMYDEALVGDNEQMYDTVYSWDSTEYEWFLEDNQPAEVYAVPRQDVHEMNHLFTHQVSNYAQEAMQPQMQEAMSTETVTSTESYTNDTGVTTPQQHWEPLHPSFEQARASLPQQDWQCPANDATLPQSDEDRQDYVFQLLTALNNVEDTIGVRSSKFRKRWFDPTKGISEYYSPFGKEALCWLILAKAESLHTLGPSATFTSFNPKFWAAVKKTRDWTFAERVTRIAEMLARCKSKCDRLLGGGSMQMVVGNPGKMLRTTQADLRQNNKRKAALEASRRKQRPVKRIKTNRG